MRPELLHLRGVAAMSRMKLDLLRRGVAALRANAANPRGAKFDLSVWARPDTIEGDRTLIQNYLGEQARWRAEADGQVPVNCGTVVCAVGLFAIDGIFKDEGLGYKIDPHGMLLPVFKDYIAFHAAAALFGISYEDSRYLFDPECYYSTPRGAEGELFVADRIERFIAGEIDKDWHPDFPSPDDEDYAD